MANPTTPPIPTTITALPLAASIGSADLFAIVQGGVTKRVTAAQVTSSVVANSIVAGSGITVTTAAQVSTVSLTTPVTVANGGTGTTTSTGTGSVVLNTSPTLITPALGTPSSGVATNLTGLNLTGGAGVTGVLPAANGGTGNVGGGWTAYTPVITSGSGTITTVSANGLYQQQGKTIFYQAVITITTAGSGSGYCGFTLPVGTPANNFIGVGMDVNDTGKALKANLITSNNVAQITNYDNTTAINSSAVLVINGIYQMT